MMANTMEILNGWWCRPVPSGYHWYDLTAYKKDISVYTNGYSNGTPTGRVC
jgi:hypothetical protein